MQTSLTDSDLARIAMPAFAGVILILSGAVLTRGNKQGRLLGLIVAAIALGMPWLMPLEHSLVRGIAALVAAVGCMRVCDLLRGEWSVGARLRHAVSLVDSRRLVPAPPRLDGSALAATLLWLVVAGIGYCGLVTPVNGPELSLALRWGAGAVFAYAGVSAGYDSARVTYAALGFVIPPLHVWPLLATSVQELWGERWARPVSTWLGETLFRPLARRRRPGAGALLAFAVSAAFHAYAVWAALGPRRGLSMAGLMFAFFLAQGALMGIERVLFVKRWKPRAGHVWTVTVMLLTSPLFVEPAVRVVVG